MTGFALSLILSAALFAAFLFGWAGHWLWLRLGDKASPREERIEELTAALLEAEAERDAALSDKVVETGAISAEFSAREQELEIRLRETQAELDASMEGLGAARRELQANAA